ncbi:MAG: hypothetical protein KC418_23210 [Anaerolineales bacterium]|nr:hypothetical protein [Anaerolineales bacterium]
MDKYELVEMLEEAQEHMREAIALLQTYVDETDDQYAKTYLVDRLVIMTSADHGFMSHDLNMGDLINRVRFGEDA